MSDQMQISQHKAEGRKKIAQAKGAFCAPAGLGNTSQQASAEGAEGHDPLLVTCRAFGACNWVDVEPRPAGAQNAPLAWAIFLRPSALIDFVLEQTNKMDWTKKGGWSFLSYLTGIVTSSRDYSTLCKWQLHIQE